MKIEIKNLKHSSSLSQETHAFTATIYVDGVRAFEASNHGTGGPDSYHPVPGYAGPSEREVDDWLKANTPQVEAYGCKLDNSLEIVVGDLIEKELATKRLARILKRKVAVISDNGSEKALFTYNAMPTPANLQQFQAAIAAGKIKGELVNGVPDAEERALALV